MGEVGVVRGEQQPLATPQRRGLRQRLDLVRVRVEVGVRVRVRVRQRLDLEHVERCNPNPSPNLNPNPNLEHVERRAAQSAGGERRCERRLVHHHTWLGLG